MDAARRLARSVLAWPVESQQGSRRNALIASTALAQQRHERDEVEEFLAARAPAAVAASGRADEARRDVI
jgi:hypothetical protein